jgi:iron complex outermembrane receptor protein
MYMATDAKSKTYGGRLEANLGDLTLGFEAYKRNWDAINYMGMMTQYVIPDVDTESFGLYGEYKKNLSDKLRLVAGLRLDTTKTEADSSKANTNLYFDYKGTRSTSKTDTYPLETYSSFMNFKRALNCL